VIEKLHRRVVEIAQANKIATGGKMRVDTTVVETDIHYPTDSSLLGDGVRVLTRIMGRAVFDQTELPARYDLDVIFRGESTRSNGKDGAPNPNCPDAFAALPSQLGLKLEAAKGPVDYIIVEHVDKPTAN